MTCQLGSSTAVLLCMAIGGCAGGDPSAPGAVHRASAAATGGGSVTTTGGDGSGGGGAGGVAGAGGVEADANVIDVANDDVTPSFDAKGEPDTSAPVAPDIDIALPE